MPKYTLQELPGEMTDGKKIVFPISKIKTRVRHLINVKWSHFLYFEG
jgi:hypothetical protein